MLGPLTASIILVFGISILRLAILHKSGDGREHKGRFVLPVIVSEARQYAYLIVLYILSDVSPHPVLKVFFRSLIALVVCWSVLDIWTLRTFFARATPVELHKLAFKLSRRYTISVLKQFMQAASPFAHIYIPVTLLFFSLLAVLVRFEAHLDRNAVWILALASLALWIPKSLVRFEPRMTFYWAALNTVDMAVMSYGSNKAYSKSFAEAFLARYEPPTGRQISCLGVSSGCSVICVVVESFSMYHSKFLSGVHDFTPKLDALMKESTVFTNFYANGNASDDGLIAMLTGEFPIRAPEYKHYPSFRVFGDPKESLPRLFNEIGHETVFLTAADFDSFQVGPWAEKIGFRQVVSREGLRYDGSKDSGLSTATDQVLYLNAIDRIQQMENPFFMVLETGTSHEPFFDPDSRSASEELCFKYADRTLYSFIRYLRANGFFENGMVLITSDHRRRRGLLKEEFEMHGELARFRIPLIVMDGSRQGKVVSSSYQQTDLFHSLKYFFGKETIRIDGMQGIFLPEPLIPSKYVISINGLDIFPTVSLIHAGGIRRILLDGDKTRFLDGGGSPGHLIDYIHYRRISQIGALGAEPGNFKGRSFRPAPRRKTPVRKKARHGKRPERVIP